jgi:hypothetical protein
MIFSIEWMRAYLTVALTVVNDYVFYFINVFATESVIYVHISIATFFSINELENSLRMGLTSSSVSTLLPV